ncbi:glycosyltransferase family 2 protein [Oribacterium sp. NK2B42]|uniref:glycosyltransferase family 2 protein n=1 Tax=Oribacterium sp. NK2B42 TaxID=689781 RepID=UPI00041A378F|nr:glycosyltransferase family 2 protein [Oribacterium sp. NK2B42]
MISLIVPVYNVEPYLRKCLDSIVNQTYRDLEILVIDDGSIDGCGQICDEYGDEDHRIKVFHTENRGLSAARNLGLDNAQGEWIGFVDSDDWIEADMYEVLHDRAIESGADIVECGFNCLYSDKIIVRQKKELTIPGEEAIRELYKHRLNDTVWNKLWSQNCFKHIRFPEGRVFEDVATTYRILYSVNRVCTISAIKYNYNVRKGSLSRKINIENLIGYWRSHKERYDFLENRLPGFVNLELGLCAKAVARTWAHYYSCDKGERILYNADIRDMNIFTKKNIPLFGNNNWELRLQTGVFFPHFESALSFRIAWIINRIVRFLKQN